MKKNRNFFLDNAGYWLRVVALGLVLGLGLQFVRAWTEPTTAPPGGNLGAPINTGDLGQYKEGGLMLNTGGALNGLLVSYGNVGIGTTSPGGSLTIVSPTLTALGKMDIFNPSNPSDISFDGGVDGKFEFWNKGLASGYTQFRSDASPVILNMNNSGNVGIGTASPDSNLHITNSGSDKIASLGLDTEGLHKGLGIEVYGSNYSNANTPAWMKGMAVIRTDTELNALVLATGAGTSFERPIIFMTRDQERMRITGNGNVGIGTASPQAKLDVQGGSIKATGGLIIETRASDPASPVNGQMWLIVP